ASRIREQGLDVYGIGQKKTPDAFRKACKRFIFVENLLHQDEPRETPRRDQAKDAIPLINAAMQALDPEGEWFPLGLIGQTIQASHPDFDSRSFGVSKLSDLVEKAGRYEIRRDGAQVQVRRRD
ncbi:MAG: Maebl, partial [Rhodobacteraceae bacterium]|nr:Maebl [Paracoccaceae bacterium]